MPEPQGFFKDIVRNSTEVVRISVSKFEGKEIINIRTWYRKDETSTEYFPTQKGIAVKPDQYDELLAAITELKEHITT